MPVNLNPGFRKLLVERDLDPERVEDNPKMRRAPDKTPTDSSWWDRRWKADAELCGLNGVPHLIGEVLGRLEMAVAVRDFTESDYTRNDPPKNQVLGALNDLVDFGFRDGVVSYQLRNETPGCVKLVASVPREVARAVKMRAAENETTISEYVLGVLVAASAATEPTAARGKR